MITNEIPQANLFRQKWANEGRTNRVCQERQNQNSAYDNQPKTVIHNHFNIIINVSPDTTQERISAIVEQLTTIVDRVNVKR